MTAPIASENDLRNAFVARVPFVFPHVRPFVRTILNVEAKGGWRARAGVPGQADVYAIVKGGGHIEIEMKASRGRWYVAQTAWRAFCTEWGIPYLVLRVAPNELPAATIDRWLEELRPLT